MGASTAKVFARHRAPTWDASEQPSSASPAGHARAIHRMRVRILSAPRLAGCRPAPRSQRAEPSQPGDGPADGPAPPSPVTWPGRTGLTATGRLCTQARRVEKTHLKPSPPSRRDVDMKSGTWARRAARGPTGSAGRTSGVEGWMGGRPESTAGLPAGGEAWGTRTELVPTPTPIGSQASGGRAE